MINKTIKITIAQIIMWAAACLADMIQYSANGFIQMICFLIVPVCLLVGYSIKWYSIHSCDKKSKLLKWIVQYIIFLVIWCLEIYFIVMKIDGLIEADRWITRKEGFLPGLIYGGWALLAMLLITVAVIMHIVCTIIRRFSKCEIIHKVINVVLVIGIIVFIFWGEISSVHNRGWEYFAFAILAGFACFFFNWCYYKVK